MIKSKLPNIGTSNYSLISKIAGQNGALHLAQEYPDLKCSEKLIDLAYHYMKLGHNQYAPLEGVMALREAIAEKFEGLYSAKYNPETEITITSGATQAIYSAITAFIKEGDEVVVFEPAYYTYVQTIESCGGRPVFINLKSPDYHIDWDEVHKVISAKTRMIIINTPNNPTGAILSSIDMEKLTRIINGTNIIILSDEVFEHIIFEEYEHQSVARFPKIAERSLIVSSFGKTYSITGWKLGYILAPAKLTEEFRKSHQIQVFSSNSPLQYALADFLKDKNEYSGISKIYESKRDHFNKSLEGSKFREIPSKGTYFQILTYSEITDAKDMDFAMLLLKEHGISTLPLSIFFHDGADQKALRFCFAKSDDELNKAIDKLTKF
jgi:methionine transaminase